MGLLDKLFGRASDWKSLVDAGNAAQGREDYATATARFQDALKAAEAFGEQDVRLPYTRNKLAIIHRLSGAEAKAEPLYLRSIAIFEKLGAAEDQNLATSLEYLAELYRSQGRNDEAVPLYVRSL